MNEFETWQRMLDEWKEVDRIRRINQRLYDYLASSIIYLIEYSKKPDFNLPHNIGKSQWLMNQKIMDEISPPIFNLPMEHSMNQQNQFLLLRKLNNYQLY